MDCTVVNISNGILHLDTLGVDIPMGGRFDFSCSKFDALIKCPELVFLDMRKHVKFIEDPEVGKEQV